MHDFRPLFQRKILIYIENDIIREVYYNPDSATGGQFVTNLHSPNMIVEAYEKCLDNDILWEYLESSAKQYLTNINNSEVMSMLPRSARDENRIGLKSNIV